MTLNNDTTNSKGDASISRSLQRIFPNLRDLRRSARDTNIKPGTIYRSARPFANNSSEMSKILIDCLGINTIIDLREENLRPLPEEHRSRLMVGNFYRMVHHTGIKRSKFKDTKCDIKESHHRWKQDCYIRLEHNRREDEKLKNQIDLLEDGSKEKNHLIKVKKKLCRRMADDMKVLEHSKDRKKRGLCILNIMDTPEFKDRVAAALKQSPKKVPFIAMCKVSYNVYLTERSFNEKGVTRTEIKHLIKSIIPSYNVTVFYNSLLADGYRKCFSGSGAKYRVVLFFKSLLKK